MDKLTHFRVQHRPADTTGLLQSLKISTIRRQIVIQIVCDFLLWDPTHIFLKKLNSWIIQTSHEKNKNEIVSTKYSQWNLTFNRDLKMTQTTFMLKKIRPTINLF